MVQIFKKGKYNILAVDWSWGSKAAYHTSIDNAKIAAKQTVIVLENIQVTVPILHILSIVLNNIIILLPLYIFIGFYGSNSVPQNL